MIFGQRGPDIKAYQIATRNLLGDMGTKTWEGIRYRE